MEHDMRITIWRHAYPDYADRMDAMRRHALAYHHGLLPCNLVLVPLN
jgi:hypothetical protein